MERREEKRRGERTILSTISAVEDIFYFFLKTLKMQSTKEERMKYSKCRCIKAGMQPDEMCVTNVLGRRLMRRYALRDTAGRTERLYRSSCCADPLARRKIPRKTRKTVRRIGKRLKGTVGKLFLLGEEQPRLLLSLGSPKLELFRFSEGKQLEEFVSHRTVRR